MATKTLFILFALGLGLAGCASSRISIVSQDAATGALRFEVGGPVAKSAVECVFRAASGPNIAVVYVRLDDLGAGARHADSCAPPAVFTADPSAVTVRVLRDTAISGAIQSLAPGALIEYAPPSPWP